jgi:site-specific DNA recombinase
MRAVDYGRVSTDEQAKEGYSIDSQKDYNLKFIESQDWDLVDSYVDDGYSAKNLKRPDMQRLINDAKARKFDVVVFYKLDRLVRSVSDLDKLLQIFDANNIGIRSVTEPFDTTTAIGRFLITLVAAIAQWERETISERVVVNMTKKATLGERNGGKAPFGYKLVDGKLAIKEDEAMLIKEIFRLYLAGKGVRAIVLFLQQFGVKKDIRTIARWIENPVYAGKLRWANNSKMESIISDEITHPAIIDGETFEKAQLLRNQRTTEGKKATSPYHFSGVLRCARCGGALSGFYKKERGTKHYTCISKKNYHTCDLPAFTEKALTERFLDEISADDPERFLQLSQSFSTDQKENKDQAKLMKDIERELAAIKTRKKNWLLALGNGVMTQEEYKSMTAEDTKKEEMLKEKLSEISQEIVILDRESILSMLKHIPYLWDTANDNEKKSFINELFESITVDVPSSYYRAPGKSPSVFITEVEFR